VQIDRSSGTPLRTQLAQAIRTAIDDGRLSYGVALPSSRALGEDLAVSRGVVVDAYAQLAAEGWLSARPGGTTRVAPPPVAQPGRRGASGGAAAEPRFDFRPGIPDLEAFPRAAWMAAMRQSFADAPAGALSYGDPQGVPALRQALASYLGRVRGVLTDPSLVIICSGLVQGVSLLCRVLRARGLSAVAVEDPGWRRGREVIAHCGLDPVAVPVDEEGLRVDRLAASATGAVMVTPAHQFPTGVALSSARRAALLAWSQKTGGLVIEDDYDAEYRYDHQPLGTLQALCPGRVVYAGSLSKTLAPALRLAWLVVPPGLVDDLVAVKAADDAGSPTLEQLTLARFMESGALDRHRRRSRLRYRAMRDRVVGTLAAHAPEVRPTGIAAGLHLLARLPPEMAEAEIVAAGARRSVGLYGLGFYAASDRPRPGALVIGFGAVPRHASQAALAALGATLAEGAAGARRSTARRHGALAAGPVPAQLPGA